MRGCFNVHSKAYVSLIYRMEPKKLKSGKLKIYKVKNGYAEKYW